MSALAGLLPALLVFACGAIAIYWPRGPVVTLINGKTYTQETLPAPEIVLPQSLPVDDPKRLDLLRSFGIDPTAIELCRKKGCRVDFTSQGGISRYGPLKASDWSYTLDPATEKWKLKE